MSKQSFDSQNDLLASQHSPNAPTSPSGSDTKSSSRAYRAKRLSYALPRTPPSSSGAQTPHEAPPPQMDTTDLSTSLSSSMPASQKQQQQRQQQQQQHHFHPDEELDSREAQLQAELESVKRINQTVEGVIASLDKAHSNMNSLSSTIIHAATLLDTWTRILSQTEHNQRLLLHPAWEGASQDIADAENETLTRQREQQRREAEEAARRQAAEQQRKRQQEERERRQEEHDRKAAAPRTPRAGARASARGRGGVGRGAASTSAAANATTAGTGATTTGPKAAMTVAERRAAGRAAVSGYGRVGSVGTKAARAKPRGGTGTG